MGKENSKDSTISRVGALRKGRIGKTIPGFMATSALFPSRVVCQVRFAGLRAHKRKAKEERWKRGQCMQVRSNGSSIDRTFAIDETLPSIRRSWQGATGVQGFENCLPIDAASADARRVGQSLSALQL